MGETAGRDGHSPRPNGMPTWHVWQGTGHARHLQARLVDLVPGCLVIQRPHVFYEGLVQPEAGKRCSSTGSDNGSRT